MNASASTIIPLDSGKPVKGVVGWLLMLCISLTIVAPIVQGRTALIALSNLAHMDELNAVTLVRLMAVGYIHFGLSVFSLCAGVCLWREDPRGPALAKAYLLFSAALVISLYILLTIIGFKVQLPRIVFQRLAYSITWYTYLRRSKRVRETYYHSS